MPWWRRRSWNTDLDTLTRLHKALQALDVDQIVKTEQQTLPELAPGPDLAPDPEAAGGQMLTGPTLAPEAASAQTLSFEAGQAEQGAGQKDGVPGPAGGGGGAGVRA